MKHELSASPLAAALYLACLLTPAHAVTKSFGCAPGDIHVSGCADVVLHATRTGHRAPNDMTFQHRIWFSEGVHRYRLEVDMSRSGPGNQRSYMIHDGSHAFAALASPDCPESRAKWATVPEAWVHTNLRNELLFRVTVREARLLWTGTHLGVAAQHWQGHRIIGGKKRQEDVWVSTDRRFPAVLKSVSAGRTSTLVWEMERLDIHRTVPGYMFLPLMHPKPGLASLLESRYWPMGYVIIWQALLLACYVGLAFSLSPFNRPAIQRVLLALWSATGMMMLFFYCPRLEVYFSQLRDTSFLLLLGVMSAAAVFGMWRAAGGAAQLPFPGNTGWQVPLWMLLAGSVAFFWAYQRQAAFATSVGLGHWALPFLPITLLNVAVFAAPNSALQEFLFRGCLYGWLQRRGGSFRALNPVQALAFSFYHIPRSWLLFGPGAKMAVDLVLMFLFGLVFGVFRRRYAGLLAPWLVHFAYNTAYLYVGPASLFGLFGAIKAM
jgi:membrane protease YdiL (CAAX protease family)